MQGLGGAAFPFPTLHQDRVALSWRGSCMSQGFTHCCAQAAPHTLPAPVSTPPPGWNGDVPGLLWTSALWRGGLSGWEGQSPCLLGPAAIYSSNLLPLFISEGPPGSQQPPHRSLPASGPALQEYAHTAH